MQNILTDDGTGVYGAAFNIYLLFLVISSAGMPSAISKMVSARTALNQYENAHKVFKVALILSSIAGLIAMGVLFFGAEFFAVFFGTELVVTSVKTLAPTVFIVAILSVYRGYFQGLGNAMPTATSQVIEQVFNAFFSVLLALILIDEGFAIAAAGGTAGSGIGALFGLFVILYLYKLDTRRRRKVIRRNRAYRKYESSKKIAKELIYTAVPIVAGTAIFSITNLIDTRMVMHILQNTGFTELEATRLFGQLNGKYVVITTLPVSIATAIAIALIPSIANSVATGDRIATKNKINVALRLTMIISIPAAVGIGVLASQILLFLFPNHPDGAELLQIGSISVLFLALNQVATGMLQGMSRLRVPVFAALVGAIVKIPINYVLISIPEINVLGAVISTTVCYLIASLINTSIVFKTTGARLDFVGVFLKPMFSAAVMGLVCYVVYYTVYFAFPSNATALMLSILIGMGTYFIVMILIKGITEKDLESVPMGKKIMAALDRHGVDY